MINRLNPRRIPNNFRLQNYIEEELDKAKALTNQNMFKLSAVDMVDIGLAHLEVGNWKEMNLHASFALTIENAKDPAEQNKEIIATALYLLVTQKRELNDCDKAILQYQEAFELAQSDWLKSNLLRNIGLAYLKKEYYASAALYFKSAFDFTSECASKAELRGSLPALLNYYGLALTKGALKDNQNPAIGLAVLAQTTELYKTIFAEKNLTEEKQQFKSHDWQSHLYHRAMILCAQAEKESGESAQTKFREAKTLLIEAYGARIANKADEQRLGDVSRDIGRVHQGLKQMDFARAYYEKAILHYKVACLPEKASQFKEVNERLASLNLNQFAGLVAPASLGQGVFTGSSSSAAAAAAPQTAAAITPANNK